MNIYLITVAYDGSDFAGWAKQPRGFTVQGYIEDILSKVFHQKINILATSRTDKWVHAHDQKFTLRLPMALPPPKLKLILTKSLKGYIEVKNVSKVNASFHPIKSVISKEYRYFLNTGQYNFFQKKYRWEYNLPLQTRKINNILKLFAGKHNFFNLAYCRWKDKSKISPVRVIELIRAWKKKDLLVIRIKARHFLRYQIRAMLGEAIKCYEGKITIEELKAKLLYPDKLELKYKHLAPPEGLYLWRIKFRM